MNSLKYLAVNTSLETGREVVGRFRMRDDCLLPRFGDDEPMPDSVTPAVARPDRPVSWWRRFLMHFGRTQPVSGKRFPPYSETDGPAGNPFVSDSGSGADAVPLIEESAVQSPKTAVKKQEPLLLPVQAEFRFENVTVVCNDLHDADFEIISRPAARRPAAELLMSA